jgi:hypothetical protein
LSEVASSSAAKCLSRSRRSTTSTSVFFDLAIEVNLRSTLSGGEMMMNGGGAVGGNGRLVGLQSLLCVYHIYHNNKNDDSSYQSGDFLVEGF